MTRPIDIRVLARRDAELTDARLGLDEDNNLAMTNQPDNSIIGTAASRDVGTDPDQIPLNSDLPESAKTGDYNDLLNLPTLGTAAGKNTGLSTGDVLTPEGAGLDSGETNWTSGNVNEFGLSAGAVGSGTASSTSVARIEIQTLSNIVPASITLTGVFNLLDSSHGLVNAGATIALSSSSTIKLLILDVSGATLIDGAVYILYADSAASKITVNY